MTFSPRQSAPITNLGNFTSIYNNLLYYSPNSKSSHPPGHANSCSCEAAAKTCDTKTFNRQRQTQARNPRTWCPPRSPPEFGQCVSKVTTVVAPADLHQGSGSEKALEYLQAQPRLRGIHLHPLPRSGNHQSAEIASQTLATILTQRETKDEINIISGIFRSSMSVHKNPSQGMKSV